jgi:hypothetical protein
MSGRLVILRHKSWHVWNQDNREKVLRDERLHREAEEAKKELENKSIQKKNMEILRGGVGTEELPESIVEEFVPNPPAEPVPFRLFEDLEQKEANTLLGHPDYLKEKAEKERKMKQKEGVADWALGEGSFESRGIVPWYQQSAKQSTSQMTIEQKDKENVRKFTQDPMAKFIHHDDSIAESKEDSAADASLSVAVQSTWNTITDDTKKSSHKKSSNKKSSHKKHSKKHHKYQHDRDDASSNSSSDSEESSTNHRKHKKRKVKEEKTPQQTVQAPGVTTGFINGISMEELRRKRLEREKNEEKRKAQLLAKVDVYGHPALNSVASSMDESEYSRRYHQQYNPTIARPAYNINNKR